MNLLKSYRAIRAVAAKIAVSTWTQRTSPTMNWYSVCWSPELGLFVAVANGGTNPVMTSRNMKMILG